MVVSGCIERYITVEPSDDLRRVRLGYVDGRKGRGSILTVTQAGQGSRKECLVSMTREDKTLPKKVTGGE